MPLIWLIPVLPAAGAALNGAGIRWFSRRTAASIACAAIGASFLASVWAFAVLVRTPASARAFDVVLGDWIPAISLATAVGMRPFHVPWAFHLDPLSAVMILIVTGIGLLIHIYSTASMLDEPRGSYARFFCYLNLFCAFMLVLVLGSNFLVLFVGWEGVGLCSYLLIGYWYQQTSAASAGLKAFLTNRIGDWALLVGMLFVFLTFGTLDFKAVANAVASLPSESTRFGTLSVISLLLFLGATGKSAQVPLHVWLPDAMEGPTPVSALIHAATIVTAGVYIVCRNAVLFSHAPLVLEIVAITGVLTALMAATVGLVQNDIKRVLAYSTISQLGYMFLAAGAGAFTAAIFHLMTHAFFKALLFLGAGVVISATAGEQDMRRMGALKKYMPVTFVTMTIGALAMSAIPPLAGFFSKEAVLSRTFAYNGVLWILGLATAGLTAFYMSRLILLTFFGESRADGSHHADDPPSPMRIPLLVLAVGSIVAGFVGIPVMLGGLSAIDRFLAPAMLGVIAPPHPSALREVSLMLLAIVVASLGLMAARRVYALAAFPGKTIGAGASIPLSWWDRQLWLLNAYYLDELYNSTFVRGTLAAARRLWIFDVRVVDGAVNGAGSLTRIASWMTHMFDKYVVDGFVNLAAWAAGEGSYFIRRLHTGLVQNYALLTILGLFMFLTLFLFAR